MVSLQTINPQRLQPDRFSGDFNAFGNVEHIKLLVDCDQRLRDHLIAWIMGNIADELTINLKQVKVEFLEMTKGLVSSTKIVRRNLIPLRCRSLINAAISYGTIIGERSVISKINHWPKSNFLLRSD